MNYNTIIFYDYETGSRYAKQTQPTSLSAVAIHSRKLEILHGGIFNSFIKPEFNQGKQEEFGLGDIEDEALEITKIKISDLEKAPPAKVVWTEFCNFVNQFNYKKTRWSAPVLAGFNNNNFDDVITDRLCGGNRIYNTCKKEPYKFGPWDKDYSRAALFHPIHNIDLMKELFGWFENDKSVFSLSMDKMRSKFGLSTDRAHHSLKDVLDGGMLLIKFMKMKRGIHKKMSEKFDNSCSSENKVIAEIMKDYV